MGAPRFLRWLPLCILSFTFAGCYGGGTTASPDASEAGGPSPHGQQQSPVPRNTIATGGIKLRKSNQECDDSGGTWKVPPLGTKRATILSGSIEYGSNNCPRKQRIGVTSYDQGPLPCFLLNGYIEIGPYILVGGPGNTFSGDSLTMTLKSDLLKANTDYTVLVDTEDGQNSQILFQYSAGAPVDGSLTIPSPFQGGFNWPSGPYQLNVQICYPS